MTLKAGFKDTLAQGMMSTCWIAEMLANYLGFSWYTSGWIKMAYVKPIYRRDVITCKAVVTGIEGDLVRVDVWCENQDGDITGIGRASGKLK